MKTVELPPIKETTADFDMIEKRIRAAFRKLLYEPLLRDLALPRDTVKNARTPLLDAVASGRVVYARGRFTGKFNAALTLELRKLGARWDRKTGSFILPAADQPPELKAAVKASAARFDKALEAADRRLAQILPEEIAGRIKTADLLDSSLWRTDRSVTETLKGITVPPQLTPERRAKIAEEWSGNLDLWIKDFAAEEILELRQKIGAHTYAGTRREYVERSIQRSYGVTAAKARFLARQETSLLLTKFKEARYTDSGVLKYRWGCVAGSSKHPVRDAHKKLEGKVFSWNDPPITTEPGEAPRRNNPGQDFNCRCFAKPIVNFRAKGSG